MTRKKSKVKIIILAMAALMFFCLAQKTQASLSDPVMIGNLSSEMSQPEDIFVQWPYAYAVSGLGDSLAVINISDPANPLIVGHLTDTANLRGASGIYVLGNYAYITATISNKLTVVDISNPVRPIIAGSVGGSHFNYPYDVYASGTRAYVVSELSSSLTIVDISNPASPVEIGYLTDGVNLDDPRGVYISGHYAYISLYSSSENKGGLTIVDVSNSTNPVIKGSIIDASGMSHSTAVTVRGDYAYVTGRSTRNLVIINISNPANPTLVGNLINENVMNGPQNIYLDGNYAYVASIHNNNLAAIDISNPANPTIVSSLTDNTNMDGAHAVSVYGQYAYVVGETSNSLSVINISNPASLSLAGTIAKKNNLRWPVDAAINGQYAYITNTINGITVADISSSTSPTFVSSLTDAVNLSYPWSIAVSGNYAYVANFTSSIFSVINVSNPASPSLSGTLTDTVNLLYPFDVFYAGGNYAYVTGMLSNSLLIINVSNPAAPVLAGKIKDATNLKQARGVFVRGNYAYVAAGGNNGLAIVNISSSTNPVLAGTVTDGTNLKGANSVYVSGNYAYLACATANDMAVVDISSSTHPVLVGEIIDNTNLKSPQDVYVSGNYAYVTAMSSNNLAVIDISSPDSPVIAKNLTDNINLYGPVGIRVSGNNIYAVGMYSNNMAIVETHKIAILAYAAGAHGALTGSSTQMILPNADGTAVTAVPDTGYHFVNWSDASTDNPRTDTNVADDISVTANFAIDTFTISASAGLHGTVTPSGVTVKDYGTSQTYTIATTTAHYHVNSVLVDLVSVGTSPTYTFSNIQANHNISATFAINTYALNYSAGTHGAITGNSAQIVSYGADGTAVTATPDTGYYFAGWSDGSTANPRIDTNAVANLSVTANFAFIQSSGISTSYCAGVVYGNWGDCVNGTQYRNVLSQSPTNCALTSAQQAARTMVCGKTPTTPTTSIALPSDILSKLAEEARIISADNPQALLAYLGITADAAKERASLIKYRAIFAQDNKISSVKKTTVNDFIVYGTPSAFRLGAGERAGVVNSYFQAFGKLPKSEADWSDVIKIANGRWPSERDAAAEDRAKLEFKKVYGRNAALTNSYDQNAVMVVAYGLAPSLRNLASEIIAARTFHFYYRYSPVGALAWNIVRAIAYSGAKR
jgi:hypothetical protein